MKKSVLFCIFAFLFFPQYGFGFSETELDSLESTGKKSFSSSSWRTELGFALQRNIELNSFHSAGQDKQKQSTIRNLFDPNKDKSLLDVSDLHYALSLNLNYSLAEAAKNSSYSFLKNTELFLNSSFNTPFTGYKSNLRHYPWWKYIHYALGDIVGGLTAPAYKKGNFLSYFSFSFIAFPLSRFSKEAGLSAGANGAVSLLYFLKKEQKWNLALSSAHTIAYRYYTKDAVDKGYRYNVHTATNQTGSFIFRQSFNKYLPSNTGLSATHFFGINKIGSQIQDLALALASSWKVKNQFYLNFSILWKDRIDSYNPDNKNVRKRESIGWLNLNKYAFSLGGSYSF